MTESEMLKLLAQVKRFPNDQLRRTHLAQAIRTTDFNSYRQFRDALAALLESERKSTDFDES